MAARQPHGTIAAAKRHRRASEDPCPECLQAERDEKNGRVDARRAAATEAAQEAMPEPSESVDRDDVLHEVLRTLRGQLREAPPQSVAGIAKQIRDTLDALGAQAENVSAKAGDVDDIAARRAEREARRSAAAKG